MPSKGTDVSPWTTSPLLDLGTLEGWTLVSRRKGLKKKCSLTKGTKFGRPNKLGCRNIPKVHQRGGFLSDYIAGNLTS